MPTGLAGVASVDYLSSAFSAENNRKNIRTTFRSPAVFPHREGKNGGAGNFGERWF